MAVSHSVHPDATVFQHRKMLSIGQVADWKWVVLGLATGSALCLKLRGTPRGSRVLRARVCPRGGACAVS